MAYRADIEIAVKGAQELKRLSDQISATSKLVNSLNNYLENIGTGGVVRNINNLQQAVSKAAAAFNDVALGTQEATLAAKNYITATQNLNSGLEERLALIRQVTEAERKQRLAAAGVRETSQYAGPIGPGAASSVALSTPLRGRTQQILDERAGRAQLNAVLQDQFEKERQLANANLDAKALKVQQALDAQAAAAAETVIQTNKLSERQKEFTLRTDEAARASRALTAEFIRQQRVQLQLQKGARVTTVELGPGGPGFSGGFTAAQRQAANEQAILRVRQEENKIRRDSLNILSREELFEIKLQKIRERNVTLEKQRAKTREGASNAIIGGAFPLLFGQGIGASIGGAAGGFAGGLAGGQLGFGLSLVGTAVGASFDQLIVSAKDFAKATREGGDAASYLEQRLGYLNPTIKTQLQNLQASGQTAKAAELAFSQLAKTMGTEGASAFLEIGKQSEQTTRSLSLLIDRFIGAGYAVNKFFQDAKFGKGGSITDLLPAQLRPKVETVTPAETTVATQRTAELVRSNDLLRLQIALTSVSAKTDLNRYTVLQKQTAQKEYENELTKISIQLKNKEITLAQNEQLIRGANLRLSVQLGEIERARVEEVRRRAEEAQQAAKQAADKAEQQAVKKLTLEGNILSVFVEQTKAHIDYINILEGEEAAVAAQIKVQDKLNEAKFVALDKERRAALIAADTAIEYNLINNLYSRRIDLLERQNKLEELQAKRRRDQFYLARFGLTEALTTAGKQLGEKTFTNPVGTAGGASPFRTDINLMTGLTGGVLGTEYEDARVKLEELVKAQNQVANSAKFMGDAFGSSIKGIVTGATTAQEALVNFFQSIANSFADMAAQMIAEWARMQIIGLVKNLFPGSNIFPTGVGNFSAAFGGGNLGSSLFMPGRATGGPVVSGNPYIVGERGPELFVPNSSGSIVPNNQLGGMGGDVSVVVNVDASGSQVQGNENQAKALGGAISAAVQAEIVKQQRPGGLLAGTR